MREIYLEDFTGYIEGSQYYEPKFKDGRIVHLDKKIDIKTKFRYNAFNDEIELVDNTSKVKSIKVAIKDPNIVTFFDDKEFLFLSYTDANESLVSGYLNPIYKGSDINIYQKKGKKFLKGKVEIGIKNYISVISYRQFIIFYS